MRIHHWIKNLLIFAALICSGNLTDIYRLANVLWGFASFCLISSGIYFVNDMLDAKNDREHPTKCSRPIASGEIPMVSAFIAAALLIGAGFMLNVFFINSPVNTPHAIWAYVLPLSYIALNIGYSLGLKNIPILDISILVAGFIIRILYGAAITDIKISNWLYLTVIASSFYFSLGKRRNELKRMASDSTRKVLSLYTEGFLDKNMYMCLALTNVFYALWSMDTKTVALYHNIRPIWTVPLVLLICMKYSMDIEGDSDGDPVEVVIRDKVLMLMCAAYAALMLILLYMLR